MKNLKRFALMVSLVTVLPTVGFGGQYSVDYILEQVRLKKLPDYCEYMGVLQAGRTEKGKELRKKYGPSWAHMHHYCWALVDLKKGYDHQAIKNLDYVLRNITRDPSLRPMVLFKKAMVLSINQSSSEAVSVYRELIEIKPDFEPAYVALANLFLQQGDKKTAREIAALGLEHIPNSEKLKALTK